MNARLRFEKSGGDKQNKEPGSRSIQVTHATKYTGGRRAFQDFSAAFFGVRQKPLYRLPDVVYISLCSPPEILNEELSLHPGRWKYGQLGRFA
jgi:hypothetical protein